MRIGRIIMGLAVFATALAVGFSLARPLAPERLHAEVEQILSELLGGDVEVGTLRISLGWGLRLSASDVVAWTGPNGPALRADAARAEIRPLSHLTGQRRVRAIRLERPRVTVSRQADGSLWPPPAERVFGSERDGEPDTPGALLSPVFAAETHLRRLLETLVVADRFEIVGGRIDFVEERAGAVHRVSLHDIRGSLARRGFFGDTRLRLATRLSDAAGERGSFEYEGHRARNGSLRLAASATGLQLEALEPWLLGTRPDARLAAQVSGALVLDSPTPGHGHLEVDIVATDVKSTPDPVTRGPLEADRVSIGGAASIAPDEVRLEDLRFTSDELSLVLDGVLARPLVAQARAELALAVRDVTVRDLRHLISWLPDVRRDEAERLFESVERGRLRLLRSAGSATLEGWQAFLAGRTDEFPRDLVVDVMLEDTTVHAGVDDHIEGLSGRLWWSDDRIEVRDAAATLNGTPLPRLDLAVDGVAHLFSSSDEQRLLQGGAEPLVGLRTFWQATRRKPESGDPEVDVRLEIDHLEHPMFFWPLTGTEARIQAIERGVGIAIERARWAGIPIRGTATWLFEPDERVEAQFSAFEVPGAAEPRAERETWAAGRFEVGPIDGPSWAQRGARGRFHARGGHVRIEGLEIELAPAGVALADGQLDLSHPDHVPVQAAFTVTDGDMAQLAASVGLPRELATGTLNAHGSIATSLRSDASMMTELDGTLELEARDGTLHKAIPAVVAVALASAAVNPFAARDQARFDRLTSRIEVESGLVRADPITLDGPDVRAYASGSVDTAREPNELDVEVVLYLFRPVDFVLEKIPLLNVLLLGPNDNLIAAHFNLDGPWDDPTATLVPHRSFTSGPGSMMFETVPSLVRRGLRAIGSLVEGEEPAPPPESEEPPAAPANPAPS